MKPSMEQLIERAKSGDETARSDLIQKYKPFILKVSASFCGRSLSWGNDEELSIALMAFNEAIDNFDHSMGSSFLSYAYLVINRRLTDYMRKEGKNRRRFIPAGDIFTDPCLEIEGKGFNDERELEKIMWKEEMLLFCRTIEDFGITLKELAASSPKHQRVRRKIADIAKKISSDSKLTCYILQNRRLPIKEIVSKFKLQRKFVETWRRYLIALIIIEAGPQFTLIKEYINSLFKGENEQ
ncbi:MAG TPA: RNA polymerase sigma-I factor [Peptococcaceae bacterium]|nr:MAG: RNA polymerase, sigma 28 subunit, FliA/WhiG subfamily [Clostridia bacterium 41_269]HBT19931.1 RNA polymerase sigma-I factor [Peptococcaceae bacterium]